MFQNTLYMFAFVLMPIKIMNDSEFTKFYVAFETYMLPKMMAGLITNEEQFEIAMTDFLNTIPDDEF